VVVAAVAAASRAQRQKETGVQRIVLLRSSSAGLCAVGITISQAATDQQRD